MPALRATKIELHGRRINSREVRTRTDLERLTITQPKRLPKSSPAMTREKEETEKFPREILINMDSIIFTKWQIKIKMATLK